MWEFNKNKIINKLGFLVIISAILFSLIINQTQTVFADDKTTSVFDENTVYDSELDVDELIGLTSNIFTYEKDHEVYLNNINNKIKIGMGLLANSIIIDSKVYILVNNVPNYTSTIYLYDLNNNYTNYLTFNYSLLNQIIIYNNYLALVGETSNNASIYLIDLNLNKIKETTFGGEGYEKFLMGCYDQNYLYLALYKQGISKDSEFVDFGTKDTYKSIIIKLDENFNIVKSLYLSLEDLNDDSSNKKEIVTDLIISNKQINLLLENDNQREFYAVTKELEIDYQVNLNKNDNLTLLTNHKSSGEYLMLVGNETTSLNLFDKQSLDSLYTYNSLGNVLSVNNYLGNLIVYFKSFGHITSYVLSEYEVIKNETLELSYLNYDLTNNLNVVVESYFEDLIYQDSTSNIEPYYENGIYGEYTINNQYLRTNKEIITIPSKLVVKEYANFINNGMYNVGFIPQYFGHCYLNGELIHLGYEITTPGTYDLELADNYNNKKKFQIYVVEDYYLKQSNTLYSSVEYIKTKDEDLEILFEIMDNTANEIDMSNIVITNLYINDEVYEDYNYDNDFLKITINEDSEKVQKLVINYFEYEYDNNIYTYDLNKTIYYQTKKQEPTLTINKTINKKNVIFSIDVDDPDTSFTYLKVQTKYDNTVVVNDCLYNNKEYELKLLYDYNTKIEFYYTDGHQLLSTNLCEYGVNSSSLNYHLEFYYEQGILKNITITFDIPKSIDRINKLMVGNTNLLTYYTNLETSHFLRNVIIISVGVFIVIFLYFKLFKKNKKKVYI